MTGMKRGSAAQVVLLPEGEIGQAVLRLAERWTLEGLLDPVYWVPANSVIEHSLIPAQVSAIVMGRTSDGEGMVGVCVPGVCVAFFVRAVRVSRVRVALSPHSCSTLASLSLSLSLLQKQPTWTQRAQRETLR